MQTLEPKTSLGLYSDLSAVYINACLLKTDGLDILGEPISLTRTYPADLREEILSLRYPDDFTDASALKKLNDRITTEHLCVAQELLGSVSRSIQHVDIVGYSGHILHHRAEDKQDVILGAADVLARCLQTPVIDRFSQTDLQAGGTGGPLLTTFTEAIMRAQPKPLAVVSLSGLSTLTYIGPLGEQYAFDVGVGCLLLDRWLQRHAGVEMDFDGTWAEKGTVDQRLLDYLLKTPYLLKQPPKTLDRDDFNHLLEHVAGSTPADGAATLTTFIVQSIVRASAFLPDKPVKWILTGGGTLNPAIVLRLKQALGASVETIAETQMPHYNLSAAGYAFLAVRSLFCLPITFPKTTGVAVPMTGGLYHAPNQD